MYSAVGHGQGMLFSETASSKQHALSEVMLAADVMRAMQTTNLLLQAGEEALSSHPGSVASLPPLRSDARTPDAQHIVYVRSFIADHQPGAGPCRAIKELHREAADKLRIDADCKDEMERLLNELQQLLVGISIMQARVVTQLQLLAVATPA